MGKASARSEGRNHDLWMTPLNSLSAVRHSRVNSRLETWTCEISLNQNLVFVSAYKHNSSLRNCQGLPRTRHLDINTSNKPARRPIDVGVTYEITQTCYLLPSRRGHGTEADDSESQHMPSWWWGKRGRSLHRLTLHKHDCDDAVSGPSSAPRTLRSIWDILASPGLCFPPKSVSLYSDCYMNSM